MGGPLTATRTTHHPDAFASASLNGTATILGPRMDARVMTPSEMYYYIRSASGAATAKVDIRFSPTGENATDATDRTRWTAWIALLGGNVSELAERIAMPSVLAPFYQLRVTGLGGNPADAIVDIWVISKEGAI